MTNSMPGRMKVNLLDVVQHRASKFAGTVTGRVEYAYGSTQVRVTADPLNDGKPVYIWLEERAVMVISRLDSLPDMGKASTPIGGGTGLESPPQKAL